MANTIYDRIHRSLTWQKIIAFNALLFMVTVIPLSLRLAQEDTENRSGAAGEAPAPSVTPPPSYPASAPQIERVTEFFGKRGDTVVVLGSNFGDYKWGSHLYVGDVESGDSDIVRWSNSVIEVNIPDGARTGKVWINVNGQQTQWDGSLLLYDVARSAQVGLRKIAGTQATMWVASGSGVNRGMIEIGHVSEPLSVSSNTGIITQVIQGSDSLGKKTRIEFAFESPISSNSTDILTISYPGIGGLAIIRAELYNESGALVPLYADPFNVKVN